MRRERYFNGEQVTDEDGQKQDENVPLELKIVILSDHKFVFFLLEALQLLIRLV